MRYPGLELDLVDFDASDACELAAWLKTRTRLSEAQILAWTGLDHDGFQKVVGNLADYRPISPVNQKMLTWGEIRHCEAEPEARLEKRVAFFEMPEMSEKLAEPELRSARFHQAHLVELYFLTNSRNAWHSTRINQYWPGCVAGRLTAAKSRAERQRTQGSVFHIECVPGLVFQSEGLTLVACDVNPSNELQRHLEVFNGPLVAGRILDTFADARRNTLLWLNAPGNWRFGEWTKTSPAHWSSRPGRWLSLDWNGHAGSATPTAAMREAVSRARRSIRLGQ